jgi:hypothetical protein
MIAVPHLLIRILDVAVAEIAPTLLRHLQLYDPTYSTLTLSFHSRDSHHRDVEHI